MDKFEGGLRPGLVVNWSIDLALQGLFIGLGIYLFRKSAEGQSLAAYLLLSGFLIRGLSSMAVYVVKGHYRSLGNDSFRSGLLLTLACALAAIRMGAVTEHFSLLLGVLFLYAGAGFAQSALQILLLKRKFWYLPLLFAILTAICAILLILDPKALISGKFERAYFAMVFVGVMGIFSQILSLMQLLFSRHLEKKEFRRMQEANRSFMADESTEVIADGAEAGDIASEDDMQILSEDESE